MSWQQSNTSGTFSLFVPSSGMVFVTAFSSCTSWYSSSVKWEKECPAPGYNHTNNIDPSSLCLCVLTIMMMIYIYLHHSIVVIYKNWIIFILAWEWIEYWRRSNIFKLPPPSKSTPTHGSTFNNNRIETEKTTCVKSLVRSALKQKHDFFFYTLKSHWSYFISTYCYRHILQNQ